MGWDIANGRAAPQPETNGIDLVAATAGPRRYGFHATMKPPFRLAPGHTEEGLIAELQALCLAAHPVAIQGMRISAIGRFLALTPSGEVSALGKLAGRCVVELDHFRDAPEASELAKRRRASLSEAQEQMLIKWGYPYVLDEFQFHLTLTSRASKPEIAGLRALAEIHFAAHLAAPTVIDALTLCGEREDGRFEQIERVDLSE
ncbi:MAG: DUF1045 domain-containing protein [Pseudomonadota bacterium]